MARSTHPMLGAPLLVAALFGMFDHAPLSAQGLTVTGYADAELWVEEIGSNDPGFYFDSHHVNLILLGEITGDLFAAVEVEYEHAGESISLEYGYLGYTGFDDLRIMAGKFILPFGRFNKDVHPTPINKTPFRPHGFSNVLPQTYNDVGVWVSGARPVSDDSRVVFDVFAVNGLLGEEGQDIRSLRGNDREVADFGRDNDKAVGGRVGLELPFRGFDLGASVYTGKYAESDAGESLRLDLLGFDAAYRRDALTLRGEIVHANQDITDDELKKTGGFVEAAYRVTNRVEPVLRFSARDMPGQAGDRRRIAPGMSFQISPAGLLRLAYAFNMERDGFETDDDQLAAQFNVIF